SVEAVRAARATSAPSRAAASASCWPSPGPTPWIITTLFSSSTVSPPSSCAAHAVMAPEPRQVEERRDPGPGFTDGRHRVHGVHGRRHVGVVEGIATLRFPEAQVHVHRRLTLDVDQIAVPVRPLRRLIGAQPRDVLDRDPRLAGDVALERITNRRDRALLDAP